MLDTGGPYPFALWIVYPQQGFLIRYDGDNSTVGGNIRICPLRSSLEIRIWDVEDLGYEDLLKDDSVLAPPFGLGPQPLENVTTLTRESFYERFKSAAIDTCFETPASLWPPKR
jgi:hypothetical protein